MFGCGSNFMIQPLQTQLVVFPTVSPSGLSYHRLCLAWFHLGTSVLPGWNRHPAVVLVTFCWRWLLSFIITSKSSHPISWTYPSLAFASLGLSPHPGPIPASLLLLWPCLHVLDLSQPCFASLALFLLLWPHLCVLDLSHSHFCFPCFVSMSWTHPSFDFTSLTSTPCPGPILVLGKWLCRNDS